MTFQEILDGITRHRANVMSGNVPSGDVVASEVVRKINEIEWALQALAEALRDREQEFKDVRNELDAAFVAMKGHSEKEESGLTEEQLAEAARRLSHGGDAPDYAVGDEVDEVNEVDEAFDEYEKRK